MANSTDTRELPLRIYSLVYLSLVTALIVLMLSSFGVGAITVYDTRLGAESVSRAIHSLPVFIIGSGLLVPVSLTLGELFAILWSIYLILFVMAMSGPSKNFVSVMKDLPRLGSEAAKGNSIFNVAGIFSALVVLITAIDFFQERAGIPTGSLPETDPIRMFVSLSYAPLVEEIGFRVTIVGLVALFLLKGRQVGWKSAYVLWSPAKYLKIILGEEQYKSAFKFLLISVVASAIFFGVAHELYGAGWKIGKISTASLAGLGLGWLYLEYGLPAAVLLHWSFNYFGSAFFFYSKAGGPTSLDPIIDFLLYSVGTLSLIGYGISVYQRAVSRST